MNIFLFPLFFIFSSIFLHTNSDPTKNKKQKPDDHLGKIAHRRISVHKVSSRENWERETLKADSSDRHVSSLQVPAVQDLLTLWVMAVVDETVSDLNVAVQ